MKRRRTAVFVIVAAGIAPTSLACEPVIPFIRVVAPALNIAGSVAAVTAAVLVKSLLFALFEKRIPSVRAGVFMFLGNIVTSLIGFLAAAMIGSGAVWMISVPLVFALSLMPAGRLAQSGFPRLARTSPAGFAALLTAALCISCIFFGVGQGAIMADRLVLYWIIKLVAIYIALIASIALTATWEEWTIWSLTGRPVNTGYFPSVIRANIYVLVFIMAFGAALMLPQRLKSPDFLVRGPAAKVAVVSR